MKVGIKKDLEIKTEKINLYKINNTYFPENTYYNSDPLPIEWLELFEKRENFLHIFEDETSGEGLKHQNLGITPFSTKKELDYLDEINVEEICKAKITQKKYYPIPKRPSSAFVGKNTSGTSQSMRNLAAAAAVAGTGETKVFDHDDLIKEEEFSETSFDENKDSNIVGVDGDDDGSNKIGSVKSKVPLIMGMNGTMR